MKQATATYMDAAPMITAKLRTGVTRLTASEPNPAAVVAEVQKIAGATFISVCSSAMAGLAHSELSSRKRTAR